MAENTLIAWTNHTHNIAWGCTKIDPGCAHCYAEQFATTRLGLKIWGPNQPRRTFGPKHWAIPEKWNRAAESGADRYGYGTRVSSAGIFILNV